MQAIHEVFTAEKWVRDAQNKTRLTNNIRTKASKSHAIAKGRNKELALKLATIDRDRRNTKDSLKNAEAQMEEQRQGLHYTEIELAIAKQ